MRGMIRPGVGLALLLASAAAIVVPIPPALSGAGAQPTEFAAAAFPLWEENGHLVSAALWTAAPGALKSLEDKLRRVEPPNGANGIVLLAAHDGTALIQLIRWRSEPDAHAWLAHSAEAPQRRRLFRPVDLSAAAGARPELRMDSSVQWSEFLLRRSGDADALSALVSPMTATMAEGGGAPDLRAVAQLRSQDDQSIALLGLWRTREGFAVFARDNTFGGEPYWAPYAENEHWMMRVVAIR